MFIDKVFMTEKVYWQILIIILGQILAFLEIILSLFIYLILIADSMGKNIVPGRPIQKNTVAKIILFLL